MTEVDRPALLEYKKSQTVEVLDHLKDIPFIEAAKKLPSETLELGSIEFDEVGYIDGTLPNLIYTAYMSHFVRQVTQDWDPSVRAVVLRNLRFDIDMDIGAFAGRIKEQFFPRARDGDNVDSDWWDFIPAFVEALKNAVIWGNGDKADNLVILRWQFKGNRLLLDIIDQKKPPIDFNVRNPAPAAVHENFRPDGVGFSSHLIKFLDASHLTNSVYDFPLLDGSGNRIGQILRLVVPLAEEARAELRQSPEQAGNEGESDDVDVYMDAVSEYIQGNSERINAQGISVVEDIQDSDLDEETAKLYGHDPPKRNIRVIVTTKSHGLKDPDTSSLTEIFISNLLIFDADASKNDLLADAQTLESGEKLGEVFSIAKTQTYHRGEGYLRRAIALLLLRGKQIKVWRSYAIDEISDDAIDMYRQIVHKDKRLEVDRKISLAYSIRARAELREKLPPSTVQLFDDNAPREQEISESIEKIERLIESGNSGDSDLVEEAFAEALTLATPDEAEDLRDWLDGRSELRKIREQLSGVTTPRSELRQREQIADSVGRIGTPADLNAKRHALYANQKRAELRKFEILDLEVKTPMFEHGMLDEIEAALQEEAGQISDLLVFINSQRIFLENFISQSGPHLFSSMGSILREYAYGLIVDPDASFVDSGTIIVVLSDREPIDPDNWLIKASFKSEGDEDLEQLRGMFPPDPSIDDDEWLGGGEDEGMRSELRNELAADESKN